MISLYLQIFHNILRGGKPYTPRMRVWFLPFNSNRRGVDVRGCRFDGFD